MKKIVALLLTAIMVLGCVPGLAENTKHERVYVVAAADGTVKSVTDNIHLENGRPVWGKNCTHCMACICDCPKEAIEYGKKSKGKPRYHFEALEKQ